MSVDKRLYKVAGVTVDAEGVAKVRYSGEDLDARVKLYLYLGVKVAKFVMLPRPMNKIDACAHLLSLSDYAQYQSVIEAERGKKEAMVAPKVAKKRGPKPKAKPAAVPAAKKAKPAKAAKPAAKKAVGKAAPVADSKLEKGEVVEVMEITDDYERDFDIEQFERMASEQI